jgi:hypothetical protein
MALMEKTTHVFRAPLPSAHSNRQNSELMRLADSLEIGESIFVPLGEWAATGFKSEPTTLVHNSSHHPRALIFGKRFSTEKQKSVKLYTGWLIARRR